MGIRCADHVTPLYPQKLALTSPTGGGRSVGIVRSRTRATEIRRLCYFNGVYTFTNVTTGRIYNLADHWLENRGLKYSLCDATVVTSYIRLKRLKGMIYITNTAFWGVPLYDLVRSYQHRAAFML